MRRADRGSGTVMGATLLFAVGILLSIVGIGGQLSFCSARAQTGSDMAALEAAKTLSGLTKAKSACDAARSAALANGSRISECSAQGSDAQVKVSVETGVPLLAVMEATSRAGPLDCK